MQNNVLLEFLNFLLTNHINLTIDEKTMLKNINELTFLKDEYEGLTIDDLIEWYYSNIRQNKQAIKILKTGVNIDVFKSLITLNDFEIKKIFSFKTNEKIYFAMIAYAIFNKIKRNTKEKSNYLSNYDIEIIKLLLTSKDSLEFANKYDKLVFIANNKIIYENLEYIKKLCIINTTNYNLEMITEIINYFNIKEIAFKYLDLLIKTPLEKVTFNLKLKANSLLKLKTKSRGIEAILSQNSYKGIENIILAILNDNVYNNQVIFDLIKNETNVLKQKNLIEFASLDFLINSNDNIINFSMMNESWQHQCLIKLYEARKRMLEKENNNNLDKEINDFYTTRSTLEKTKSLRDSLKKNLK